MVVWRRFSVEWRGDGMGYEIDGDGRTMMMMINEQSCHRPTYLE